MAAIKCPLCGTTADAGGDPITEGGFPWECRGCETQWEVRTVFFKQRDDFNVEQFRTLMIEAMEDQKMTQQAVGRFVGVSGAYISVIAAGKRVPSLSVARRILEALGEHEAADNL